MFGVNWYKRGPEFGFGHYTYTMGFFSTGYIKRRIAKRRGQAVYQPLIRTGRGRHKRMRRYRAVLGPKRMQTRLRFANRFILDAGAAGAAVSFVMSANGMFDPELGAGGHQPRGFDQYMAMWNSYGVVRARITVTFAQDANTNDASACGIIVKDDSGTITGLVDNMESYDVVSGGLGRVGDGGPLTLTKRVSILNFLGRGGDIADDDDLQGSVSANPVDGVFFIVFAGPLDPAIDNGPINCICWIDYYVDFFQRKRPPASEV